MSDTNPDTPAAGDTPEVLLLTLAELHQDTDAVLARINTEGKPAVVTRHGRFIARIDPLVGRNVEGEALARLLTADPADPADTAAATTAD